MTSSAASSTLSSAVSPASTFGRIRIVLSHTSHPGNIGAAARAMKAMGLTRLVLVNPKQFPDPQATARAVGADDVLAQATVVTTLTEALAGTTLAVAMTARRRELAVPALWCRDAAALLATTLESSEAEIAVVFGNESAGLSNDELAQCARWAMVPVNPEFSSLNVAAAVQLMCYELRLALLNPGPPPAISGAGAPAGHDEVEHFIAHLERAAVDCGFLDPAAPKRFNPRMRRLFARATVEKEEVAILRGLIAALEKPFSKTEGKA